MASETELKQIVVSTVGGEPSEQDDTGTMIASNEPAMANEADNQIVAGLEAPKPTIVERLSSLDMRLKDHDQDDNSDNSDNSDKDSAKAGLDDDTDDDLDSDISTARKRHMERLADIYARMEQASRDHDAAIETAFRAKIKSLDSAITQESLECDRLRDLVQQKDNEISRLHQEMTLEDERHRNELSQQEKSAEEERRRAGEEWQWELHEAMETRGREHQQAMEEQQQQHQQAMEAQQQQHQQAMEEQQGQHEQSMASLREEMTKESDKRVSNLLEELGREAEQRVNKVRAEMGKMKADFEREREQTMKEMRSEMSRLVEREREARERCRRLEMAHRGHGQTRDESPHIRQPLQSSNWAIARLWGVGQTRARSFS